MPDPQSSDVEETVPPDRCAGIADGVAVVIMVVIAVHWMVITMSSESRRYFGLPYVPLPERLITEHPILAIGIPGAVLALVLYLKKRRGASRTGVNGDCDNGGTAEVLDDFVEARHDHVSAGSDGAGEHGIVRPPVVTILRSSSSRSGGDGVLAGSEVVTAGDVEPAGGASHHRRGERTRGVDTSGEAARDGKAKNA